jgi:hypothetical protein
MPTYSEEDLTTVITAYRNSEYTLIRKYAYVTGGYRGVGSA